MVGWRVAKTNGPIPYLRYLKYSGSPYMPRNFAILRWGLAKQIAEYLKITEELKETIRIITQNNNQGVIFSNNGLFHRPERQN